MLQFLAQTNNEYSIAEQVQMAIEGGCAWVHLRLPDMDDTQVREIAGDIIAMCRESQTILTIDDRYELAKQLAIHGVLLANPSEYGDITPSYAREILGPEAIIGVQLSEVASVVALQGKDIDYVVLGGPLVVSDLTTKCETIHKISQFVKHVSETGVKIPLVATGDITVTDIDDLKNAGINGLLVGKPISTSQDPVETTKVYINKLNQ